MLTKLYSNDYISARRLHKAPSTAMLALAEHQLL